LVHLGGAVVFATLGIVLLERGRGDRLRSTALLVYVFSVVFALLASGSFHAAEPESSVRAMLHRADHVGIFLLIAGTYTPIHIIQFKGLMRWGVLGLVWSAAIAGILVRWMLPGAVTTGVGILIYLGLGWIGLGSAIALYRFVGLKPLIPLIGGALAYTIGAILESAHVPVLLPRIVGHHEVFHIFVLIGVSLHWQYIRSIVVQAPIVDLYSHTVPIAQRSGAT
jgi:channel protein (hemolysin III family)